MPIPGVTEDHAIGAGTGLVTSAVLIQLIKWARGKRQANAIAVKSDAAAAATLAAAWQTLLEPLQDEVARLSKAHENCESKSTKQQADIEELKNEVATLKVKTGNLHTPPI